MATTDPNAHEHASDPQQDAQVRIAVSHWAPRFVANGVDMSDFNATLARIRTWQEPEGRLFIHVFSHRHSPYRFDHRDDADWIAKYFFTGGIMPSHGLIGHFPDCFTIEKDWRWSGLHYARTARDWLARFDDNRDRITEILSGVYGADAGLWRRRWRLFYLATEGLFGHAQGREWGVSHYLLRPGG